MLAECWVCIPHFRIDGAFVHEDFLDQIITTLLDDLPCDSGQRSVEVVLVIFVVAML